MSLFVDPGSAAEDTGGIHRLISASVIMCGIFIISTLIGALTTGMEGKLAELRKGRTEVIETNHTSSELPLIYEKICLSVILGWSSKIFDIINELVIANENQHHPSIVILAPKDRLEMQEIISQKINGRKNTKIICRNGDPMSIHDINILSPNHARSIIILAPGNDNPDVSVIKTILAITNNPRRTKIRFHIVAEIQQRNNIEVARIAGRAIELKNEGFDIVVLKVLMKSSSFMQMKLSHELSHKVVDNRVYRSFFRCYFHLNTMKFILNSNHRSWEKRSKKFYFSIEHVPLSD